MRAVAKLKVELSIGADESWRPEVDGDADLEGAPALYVACLEALRALGDVSSNPVALAILLEPFDASCHEIETAAQRAPVIAALSDDGGLGS